MKNDLKTKALDPEEVASVMSYRRRVAVLSVMDHYVDGKEYLAAKIEQIVEELGNQKELV